MYIIPILLYMYYIFISIKTFFRLKDELQDFFLVRCIFCVGRVGPETVLMKLLPVWRFPDQLAI